MQNSNKSPLSEKQKPANSAPLASPLAVSPKAASDYKNTASEGSEADYKFCSKESILDQLKISKDVFSDILKHLRKKKGNYIDINDEGVAGMEKIKITLNNAIKFIEQNISENSFSSKPANSLTATKPFSDGGGEK